MAERYIAFDVETPNSYNHRMSSIGITVVENGSIIRDYSSLINPETHFDPFNIQLTEISPAMVKDAPTFPQLWPKLEELFSDAVLLAHNAPFDMGVLAKCLRAYGISWRPYVQYACTCRMSRKCYPHLENHKLNTVSRFLGISLEHHQAASDAHACAEIFCACMEDGLQLRPFLKAYDMERMKTLGGNPWEV